MGILKLKMQGDFEVCINKLYLINTKLYYIYRDKLLSFLWNVCLFINLLDSNFNEIIIVLYSLSFALYIIVCLVQKILILLWKGKDAMFYIITL